MVRVSGELSFLKLVCFTFTAGNAILPSFSGEKITHKKLSEDTLFDPIGVLKELFANSDKMKHNLQGANFGETRK